MVSGDGDGVPARDMLAAVGERVCDKTHGRPRREYPSLLRYVLLENVILDGPTDLPVVYSLSLRNHSIERQQDRSGRIDGHGGGHLIQGDVPEYALHVMNRVYGDSAAPHLTQGHRVSRVFAPVSYTHLRAHETKANLVCRLLLEKK